MKALITGGAGFIGSHLAENLLAAGNEVIVFDDFSTGSVANLASVIGRSGATVVIGDVRDRRALERACERCDMILHLAASVGVRRNIEHSYDSLRNNVLGLDNVISIATESAIRLMIASSSEVYGTADSNAAMAEAGPRTYGATDVSRWAYAGAKALGESLAMAAHREFGLDVVVVRFFNVAGPRQNADIGMVLPTFVRQAIRGEPITVFGDGSQRRSFVHVREVVEAVRYLMLPESAATGIYNLGSDRDISILDLAHTVRTVAASPSEIHFVRYADAYPSGFEEIPWRRPDLSRIREATGFKATVGMVEIVRDVIEWEHSSRRAKAAAQPAARLGNERSVSVVA